MPSGTIKFFLNDKGFGFIVPDDKATQEIFVHVSGLLDEIKPNDRVTYEVKEGRQGPSAFNVKVAV